MALFRRRCPMLLTIQELLPGQFISIIVEIDPGMAGKIWTFCRDIRKKSWTELVKF